MHYRYLKPKLTSSMSDLGRNQTDTPANPLDVPFPIGRRQNQIPKPQADVVSQLCAQKINPVRHESPHREMKEKLIAELTDPLLTASAFIMHLHKPSDISSSVGHHHIVGIDLGFKEHGLSGLVLFLLSSDQITIVLVPPYRLIPNLCIGDSGILGVLPPERFRKVIDQTHQRSRLISRDGECPSFILTELNYFLVIKGRIAAEVNGCDTLGNLLVEPPKKGGSLVCRVSVAGTKLRVNQFIGLVDKGIEGLKRVNSVIASGCPLLLLPVDLMDLASTSNVQEVTGER